ncbi:alkaline phosphatase family protein [Cohnella sp. AR92]|uniref:alkaline phosphatase family protein n=1 Tax=Cohnella sp. AR92 TaxID=648716 RepID=UPI000F8D551B|nr:alkaline phosphatase family protein [Cohnella sp. AR92]RUS44264.1 alkaline phosphatase family protein [Cohnella sp. AR92]
MRRSVAPIILVVLILAASLGCQRQSTDSGEQDLMQIKSNNGKSSTKVILLLIDSLMAQQIDHGILQKELPAFKKLIEQGHYYKDMVSSFPTMSVSIDSSLMTGAYPNEHRIPGLTWYSWEDKKVINYGTGPMEVAKQGVGETMVDAVMNLNGSHLNSHLTTIYEDLARRGKTSGSINGLIYRGSTEHQLTIPAWLQAITKLPHEVQVKGPDLLALGTLANPFEEVRSMPDGVADRFGINNSYSLKALNYLIDADKLPDFLYVYLPDLDQKIHKKGLSDLGGIKDVDQQLQPLLDKLDSRKKSMDKVVLMIAGDSGMTQILPAASNSKIDLPSILKDYQVLPTGEKVSGDTDIVLAVNETMAYLYNLDPNKGLGKIAQTIAADSRIGIVSWREGDWIRVVQGETGRELKYKQGGSTIDPYEQKWTIVGDLAVLDLKIDESKQALSFGQYPDALMRLSGSLHSHEGEYLVITAKPGYELADRSSPTHAGGGGHGSLHRQESLVPLILYGTDQTPQYLRIIDLKPFILNLLDSKTRVSSRDLT